MKRLVLILFVLVGFDQYTKQIIYKNFYLYESISVIKGFFSITYILNPGAAFGFLANMSENYRVLFFVFVTIIAIALVIYLLIKEKIFKIRKYAYTFILAGAFGNLIDRIWLGKVIDFLDFYIKDHHWPAFNVADIAISVGVGLLLIDMIFFKKDSLDTAKD